MFENKLDGKSFDIVEDNISKLKELFPEIVTGDNEVDIDTLADIFKKNGEDVVDDSEEHYKFTWWGKKEAKRVAKETTTKTLRPIKNDSKNWDSTENIYIEGDNLDALKILLGSYRNRIKMIYIDPPYNTGKDFVYKDNRTETNHEHLESTGQLSEEGFLFENAKTDGKYHSNWLNMMYPRLYLARKLLADDGVIFISIDDNEIENLKKLCNEIFGEENFVGQFNWYKSETPPNLSKKIKKSIEYILVYEKRINNSRYEGIQRFSKSDNGLLNQTNSEKTLIFPKGIVKTRLKNQIIKKGEYGTDSYKIILEEDTEVKDGLFIKDVILTSKFKWSQEKLLDEISNNTIISIKTQTLSPSYEKDSYDPEVPKNFIDKSVNVDTTENAGKYLKKLFDNKKIFDYPKPVSLMKYLFNFKKSGTDEIYLDFFSGSASTAQSIFELNNDLKKKNKFILVQLPEETDENSEAYKAGYQNICEIGKERIRRAGNKIVEESGNTDLDIGFKVFKIDESNFIPWNPVINKDNVEQAILKTGNNLVDGRSELDLVYELLLKLNMDLNSPVEETNINGRKVYVVDNGYLLICLENNVDASIADDLLKLKDDLMVEYCEVILKDEALDDNSSINIYETLNSSNVKFYTI